MRESGHDTTYRLVLEDADDPAGMGFQNRCADMVTVDLNSLLYRYEVDVAYLSGNCSRRAGTRTALSRRRTERLVRTRRNRMALMKRHLWSARDGLFYDALRVERQAPCRRAM